MPSRQNKRAQGGGRTPNSEPRLQVFRDFSGVNFQHADRFDTSIPIDTRHSDDADQTDLQMNYVFLQNNVSTAPNKTMETRDDIVTLFEAPSGSSFTGPVLLSGGTLYAAKSDGNVGWGSLDARYGDGHPISLTDNLTLVNNTGSTHRWTSFDHYDNKLMALTEENEMWVMNDNDNELENAKFVPDPQYGPTLEVEDGTAHVLGVWFTPVGELEISDTLTDACPYRIEVAYSYVTMFGPTKVSPNTVFYASKPVSEWHFGCHMLFHGGFDADDYGDIIRAVEFYYSVDNAMSLLFLGRVDVIDISGSLARWRYDWYGYVDATSMWVTANLIAPTENYTLGVHASRVCNIDGRMYFWGDKDEPQRLYIGGNPGNLLSISPGTGGGFVDVEPGTNQEVRYVCKYKTQSGNSIVTMLCDSPNSRKEQRFNLVEDTVSLSNEQSMKSWEAEQVAGAVGCKSYYGAVVCQDGLYSISRYGLALTTMTMEYNSQIRTNYVSDAIKPVFINAADMETRLSKAMLLELDGIIYMALGTDSDQEGNLDNVLFCYDIDLKAWWTNTLDVDSPILSLFHVDWQGQREGIGIVTSDKIYMLPTTVADDSSTIPDHGFLIETAKLSTQMPQQGWQYLSQLEFRFDHFVGDMTIHVKAYDMFGRKLDIKKTVSESDEMDDYVVYMRVDQRLMSYVVSMEGVARFRLTHFIARVYTISNKLGQVWGFDDSISHRSAGSVHPTFKCYNDVRKAIFT